MRLKYVLLAMSVLAPAQTVTVQVDGRPVGAQKTLNLISGNGIVHACSESADKQRVDCTPSLNTAIIPTHDSIHANENYCASTNSTTAYSCTLPGKALHAYKAGMTFVLTADTACTAACTLDIDRLGRVSIKQSDGTTDPGGALLAAQPQWIFYDGNVFRLMGGSAGGSSAGSPADSRGDVRARRIIGAMDTIAYQPAMLLDVTAGDVHKIRTAPNVGSATLNAGTAGLAGQHMWIIVSNDNTAPKTITFGANFLTTGALTGAVGRSATIHFISDGTAWYEVARTVGL
jgi:hypothetical protein